MSEATQLSTPHVRRVDVADEPLIGADRYDYADAFEVRVTEADDRTAEQFARTALENAPWLARNTVLAAWQYLLRFRLGPLESPDHILGVKIVRSEPDVLHLEGRSSLMRGAIVARRLDPRTAVVTTFVFFQRPAARVIWTIAAPLHRFMARYLMAHAASTVRGS